MVLSLQLEVHGKALKIKDSSRTPNPVGGICLKSRQKDGEKVFINLCHTKDMPAPRDVTEGELMKILESDEPSSYKIAMSLADAHIEADKGGNPCLVYDVAINSDFFRKVESSKLFKRFVYTVICEGLENKYKFEFDPQANLNELKNRKVMGILQFHRIEQRPINYSNPNRPKVLIEEMISSKSNSSQIKGANASNENIVILKSNDQPEHLIAYVKIDKIMTPDLQIGEDRIIVRDANSIDPEPFIDVFIPCLVKQDAVVATVEKVNQILKLTMPVA